MREKQQHWSSEALLQGDARSEYRHERWTEQTHLLEEPGVSAEYSIILPRPIESGAEAMQSTFGTALHPSENARAEKKSKGNFLKFLRRALMVAVGALGLAAAFIAPHIGHIAMVLGSVALFGITLWNIALGVTLIASIVIPYLLWRFLRKRKQKMNAAESARAPAQGSEAETFLSDEHRHGTLTAVRLEEFEGKKTCREVLEYLQKQYPAKALAGQEHLLWILDEKNKKDPEARKLNYGNYHFFGAAENGTVPYVHRDDKFYQHNRSLDDMWDETFFVLIHSKYASHGSNEKNSE